MIETIIKWAESGPRWTSRFKGLFCSISILIVLAAIYPISAILVILILNLSSIIFK